jgi:hypothetical protein
MASAMKTIQMRRDTAARWARLNPVLNDGEPALERDTGRFKIGDGSTRWLQLEYFLPFDPEDLNSASLAEHINAAEPHPVYDDGPSLELLYQNAKV